MNSVIKLIIPALLILLLSLNVDASPSNKWRLKFSGGADSDGVIVLRLSPEGGNAIEARISIEKGRSENGVAKDVTKSLKTQLSEDVFHVERDDGEDVLIKKRHGEATFDVEITSNSVDGVRIKPHRE